MVERILIIGSTGLLGQALCREFSAAGTVVFGLARSGADFDISLPDPDGLREALEACNPDVIVNAAALVDLNHCENDPTLAYGVNAQLVGLLTNWCQEYGRRLVHISTDHFFSGSGPTLHDEASPVTLLNEYARTKFAGEAFALCCPDTLILRTNFTGWRGIPDRPTFLEWAVTALMSGTEINGFTDYHTSTLDAGTVAKAVRDLLLADATGILNVGASEIASKWQFLTLLATRLGQQTSQVKESIAGQGGLRRATNLGLDSNKAERILGWELPNTETVVDNLISNAPEGVCESLT